MSNLSNYCIIKWFVVFLLLGLVLGACKCFMPWCPVQHCIVHCSCFWCCCEQIKWWMVMMMINMTLSQFSNQWQNCPPLLTHVLTLPCEMQCVQWCKILILRDPRLLPKTLTVATPHCCTYISLFKPQQWKLIKHDRMTVVGIQCSFAIAFIVCPLSSICCILNHLQGGPKGRTQRFS